MIIKQLPAVLLAMSSIHTLYGQEGNKIEFNGNYEMSHMTYFTTLEDKINNKNENTLDLKFKSGSEGYKIYTDIQIREDFSDESRRRILPQELYVDLYRKNLDIRIGKQITGWGRTDIANPTKNINPVDYSDIIENKEIGLQSISSKYYLGKYTLEALFAPVIQMGILPDRRSRWYPEYPKDITIEATGDKPYGAYYTMKPSIINSKPQDNFQYAAKLTSEVVGIDYSVSYYRGIEDIPVYLKTVERMTMDSIYIAIAPMYYNIDVFGADFETIILKWGARCEMAYIKQNANKLNADAKNGEYFYGVVGIDKKFYGVFGNNDLYVNLQWSKQHIVKQMEKELGLNHLFQNTVIGKIELISGYKASYAIRGIYDVENSGYFISPEITLSLYDNVKLSALLNILEGSRSSYFGKYSENDRLHLKLGYTF